MREIKFRAFKNDKFIFSENYGLTKFFDKLMEFDKVQQYTGLKDKNGVEIYEGDYLVDEYPVDDLSEGYHESFLPVVWCSKTLQWCVDASFAKDGSYLTSLVEYFGEFLEVKGNIYENPDLC